MTFGDVDQQNEQALQTQDRIDNDPDVQEPLDEPRLRGLRSLTEREESAAEAPPRKGEAAGGRYWRGKSDRPSRSVSASVTTVSDRDALWNAEQHELKRASR